MIIAEKNIIFANYINFANIFLRKLPKILFNINCINKHIINFINNK